jgi:outer membrane protein assembly factor BamB
MVANVAVARAGGDGGNRLMRGRGTVIIGRVRHLALLLVMCACNASLSADDWHQFLGPNRDGSTAERLKEEWGGAPKVLWKRDVGAGFAGPVVVGGNVIAFHRVKDREVVECLGAATGKVAWTASYPTQYADDMGMEEGPRATPAVHDGRIYTLGADGELACWNLDGGERPLWMVETRKQFDAPKGFFGMACSPIVEGDAVMVNVGGKGAGVVAFDRKTGKVLWKATDHEAGYASPTVATLGGRRLALFLTREGLVAIEPATGIVAFEHPFRSRQHASVNAATPLVIGGDSIFLSASYETGAALLKLDQGKPKVAWANDESLSNHYATSVHRDGHLYGFHGRQEQGQQLRCVELKTGRVMWSKEGLAAGTVTLAGDRLLVLTEKGQLVMAKAEPKAYEEVARAQVLGFNARAYPAISNGRVFARDGMKLVCLELGTR